MSPLSKWIATGTLITLLASIVGIGSCVQYERQQERLCRAAGGALVIAPTSAQAAQRGCYRVEYRLTPILLDSLQAVVYADTVRVR